MGKEITPLSILIGRELSSVEFVRDYLQLRFDGPCLTVITNPLIEVGSIRFARSDKEFCNALCDRIGSRVEEVWFHEDEELRINFQEHASISISLRPQDCTGSEAASFKNDAGKLWVW